MKYLLSILLLTKVTWSSAQKILAQSVKAELDTSFFDENLHYKYFGETRTKIELNTTYKRTLHLVSIYNSYIGKILKDESIKVKFHFGDSSIKSLGFALHGKSIKIIYDDLKNRNGMQIGLVSASDGMYRMVSISEFKNDKKDGIACDWYSGRDTFILIKSYFKNGRPIGKLYSYYKNGTLKEEGDSLFAYNFKKVKVAKYNTNGEIVKYKLEESYETKKKGHWRYYQENGKLLKEEYFE